MIKKIKLKIIGIHCESCIKIINLELEDKVSKIVINLDGSSEIDFDDNTIGEQEIKKAIIGLGYKLK